MSHHSVAEAKNKLSDLIARAAKGEDVVITRHGVPVAEIRPVRPTRGKVTQADLDWLDAHRVEPGKDYPGAVELVRQMRDESY
ncbi:type II toxin-antitoxin system prevent-host-death family antitoxin [Phenylobacterium sp. SCN 70-31]|uniref:type II toxin-antitoxin system Phd/YefM family antitoxin n=1 Tax=Phenylobacterium sp. SCN 70-31 TaxID=1660129 RepID=UPI00086D3837|nr:type II toxin-antitoxin system prevent-host-death family antitoxin [Phenylobacterium sp. SCN 70-31]ODT88684.1 MAG: hypothetical protein ABS78_05865 [Phenylobacterium sp. SCN 70-31]